MIQRFFPLGKEGYPELGPHTASKLPADVRKANKRADNHSSLSNIPALC